jgi:hypothetical protein
MTKRKYSDELKVTDIIFPGIQYMAGLKKQKNMVLSNYYLKIKKDSLKKLKDVLTN